MRPMLPLCLATGLVALGAIGCVPRYEWHEIQPINNLEARTVSRSGTEVKEENEKKKEIEKQTTETIQGVWLYRLVRNNFLESNKPPELRAIEVMFCPSREADISTCRTGVVWRDDHHPYGEMDLRGR